MCISVSHRKGGNEIHIGLAEPIIGGEQSWDVLAVNNLSGADDVCVP